MVKTRIIFIIFLFASILTWTPSPTFAQECITNTGGPCPAGQTVTCGFTFGNGIMSSACCTTTSACTAFKQNLANNATGITNSKNPQAWNPQGSCANGIDTALGCLPYEASGGGFTTSLLTLLAGVTGAIALAIMLMATIQIMTAGGNAEQLQKGKELLTGAITGLLFIVFSVTLLRLIAGDIIQLEGFQ